jgi:hypothetical protein
MRAADAVSTSKHNPGQPCPSWSSTGGTLPTQRPRAQPTPVAALTFSSIVQSLIYKESSLETERTQSCSAHTFALAFENAEAQAPEKSGIASEPTSGGLVGSLGGKAIGDEKSDNGLSTDDPRMKAILGTSCTANTKASTSIRKTRTLERKKKNGSDDDLSMK